MGPRSKELDLAARPNEGGTCEAMRGFLAVDVSRKPELWPGQTHLPVNIAHWCPHAARFAC